MIKNAGLVVVAATAILVGCDSGDINIQPSTTVTNSNNVTQTGGSANDICASRTNSGGQTLTGTVDGNGNCVYSPAFADAGNRITADITFPALPNGAAHIFEGSLFIGETFDTDAELAAAGITQGGDGPTLTVEAGATLAWQTSADFMIINRGSQIFAVGRADAPITFTSVSDVEGTVGPEDVQQWGGIVINGFGVTNACDYTGSVAGGDLATTDCHVDAEGAAGLDESQYGGDNNDDSSGRLEFVVVKHTGATVGNGDELNGISFGGVGRNTIVRNLEVYSTFDDGIEMFGGAVNFENFLAVYVRDDSIDVDEGYSGTITNALVIQSESIGNHCIEADGIGSYSSRDQASRDQVIAQGINSRPVIHNLTCIISPTPVQGDFDPGAGWRLREGIWPVITNSLVITSFAAADTGANNDNYCLRIDNPETEAAATNGDLRISSTLFACEETFRSPFAETFFNNSGNQAATLTGLTNPTAAADPDLQLLEGAPPFFSTEFATSLIDGMAPLATADPSVADMMNPDDPTTTYVGGIALSIPDWTAGWTFGINPDNRSQPLWFE
ncbi:MAG: serine/threonine protein kinase [Pseudomonadota bacterium]